MLQAHYRSVLDFTDNGIQASEKGYKKLMEALKQLETLSADKTSTLNISDWQTKCYNAMNDDFNTPVVIANLFDAVKFINQIKEGKASVSEKDLELLKRTMHAFVYDILGLTNISDANENTEQLNAAVSLLIELRQKARADKDFATSDKIRDDLAASGIQLKDGKEGTTFSTK